MTTTVPRHTDRLPDPPIGPDARSVDDLLGPVGELGAQAESADRSTVGVPSHRELFEAIDVAVYATDIDGRITLFNSAAVALCVDLSWSMYAEDRWAPMKQTAMALAHLVATQHPSDAFEIIGFDRTARTMSTAELRNRPQPVTEPTNASSDRPVSDLVIARNTGSHDGAGSLRTSGDRGGCGSPTGALIAGAGTTRRTSDGSSAAPSRRCSHGRLA